MKGCSPLTQAFHRDRLGEGRESPGSQWIGGGTENETCKGRSCHTLHRRPLRDRIVGTKVKVGGLIERMILLIRSCHGGNEVVLKQSRSAVFASRTTTGDVPDITCFSNAIVSRTNSHIAETTGVSRDLSFTHFQKKVENPFSRIRNRLARETRVRSTSSSI